MFLVFLPGDVCLRFRDSPRSNRYVVVTSIIWHRATWRTHPCSCLRILHHAPTSTPVIMGRDPRLSASAFLNECYKTLPMRSADKIARCQHNFPSHDFFIIHLITWIAGTPLYSQPSCSGMSIQLLYGCHPADTGMVLCAF